MLKFRQGFIRPDKSVLSHIFRFMTIPDHHISDIDDPGAVPIHQHLVDLDFPGNTLRNKIRI
jgi:hypothetical protein